MAYDLEEQEQIESLKAWWKQYGNLVTWVLIVAMLAYSAWQGWKYYERRQAGQASQLYSELEKAVVAKDQKLVLRAASDNAGQVQAYTLCTDVGYGGCQNPV